MTQNSPTLLQPELSERPASRKPVQSSRGRRMLAPALEYGGMLAVLVILIAVFGYFKPLLLSREQVQTLTNQIAAPVVVAVGMTYILIIGGIDLSVGSVLGLAGSVMGMLLVGLHLHPAPGGKTLFDANLQFALPWAVLIALGVGLVCGLLNGAITMRWTIPSFIVTLGFLLIARGAAHWLTDSRTVYIPTPEHGPAISAIYGPSIVVGLRKLSRLYRPFCCWSGDAGLDVMDGLDEHGDLYLVLSLPFLVAVGIVIVAQLVLSRTVFGRYMVAIGTNEEAVRLSGIDPRRVKLAVFAISGVLSAVAGVIVTARMECADPNAGNGYELEAIAAAVIGGTSLMGGRGSVISTFFGVLIMAVLSTGLVAMGAKDETKRMVTGCVIIAAVILDHYRRRLGGRIERAA